MEAIFTEHGEAPPLPCLISALTRLMTQYAVRPTAGNAGAVVRVLKALAVHPQVSQNAVLHNTYGRMLPHWQCLVACASHDGDAADGSPADRPALH